MPPLKPKATVPVPAPTEPSSTTPPAALASASRTWLFSTCMPRISFRVPSLVSPTTTFTERTFSFPFWPRTYSARASAARHTESVLVSTMGDSITPSSSICVLPISFPKPFPA